MKQIVTIFALLVCFAAQAYEPLIREDRIWEYEFIVSDFYETKTTKINFRFNGTVSMLGNTYYKLNYWLPESEDKEETTIAYMRENKRGYVYRVLAQKTLRINGIDCNLNNIDTTEAIMYNFDKNEIAMLLVNLPDDHLAAGASYIDGIVHIESTFARHTTINLGGKDWKLTQYGGVSDLSTWPSPEDGLKYNYLPSMIEGVGNVGRGLLYMFSDVPIPVGYHQQEYSEFVRMTDLKGNVIFDVNWIKDPNNIETVKSELPSDGRSYDLTGKPTENPAPGTVYIQNGRKHIAR